MPRILITGAGGFVGSRAVSFFLEKGWEIVAVDSLRHRGDSGRLPAGDYTFLRHDLAVPFTSRQLSQIGQLQFILNAASESHVDRSIHDPVPFVQNNVNLMLTMLELARSQRDTLVQFVQVSTDEVYGPAEGDYRHQEWDTHLPSNPYAASKAAQEALAISYWRTYDVPLLLLNTMNMIGPRQDPEKYLPRLIRDIRVGKKVIVHGNDRVIGSRFYLHVGNFVDAVQHLLARLEPSRYSEGAKRPDRYHVVGQEEVDNLSLARQVARLLGKPLSHTLQDFHLTRPGHDRRYALSGARLASAGWVPPLRFEDALASTVRWYVDNPEWLK